MDTQTAISRMFHIFAGVDLNLLGVDWDRGIADELSAIRADELAALRDIRARLAACTAGDGSRATGVENWQSGFVALLRALSRSGELAVRAFLYEMTSVGGDADEWLVVRKEAQRLLKEGAEASWVSPPPPPQSVFPVASGTVQQSNQRPLRGLVLPVILLFFVWIFTLLSGSSFGAYPNALLCVYSSAYCMLLGCALPLLQHKRYAFAAMVLLFGALLSALTLGWAKMLFSRATPQFFRMLGYTQFWLDFIVLIVLAALIAACALLLPRMAKGGLRHYTAPIGGFLVFIFCTIVMLVSLPSVTFLSVLFSLFTGILLGALTAATAALVDKTDMFLKRRLRLGGGAVAWFSFCIALSFVNLIWIGTANEAYAPIFMLSLGFVQIATLIVLLAKRPGGYLWYVISSLAIFMCGITNFLFAYVVSGSWLPLVLFGGLFSAVGPALGWLFVRKHFRAAPAAAASVPAATFSNDSPHQGLLI